MKVVFCLNAICYAGGIEKITIVKANALAELPDFEVYIAVADHNQRMKLLEPLSPKVHLMELEVNYYENPYASPSRNPIYFYKKKTLHRKKLESLFDQVKPDIVIGVGQAEKYLLPRIEGPWKTIREFHFARNYRKFYQPGFRNLLLNAISDVYDHYLTLPKYDKVILLTHEDHEKNWHGSKRFEVIPNMLTIPEVLARDYDNFKSQKKIVTVSRLAKVKNIDKIIEAFAIVEQKHPDWTLEIYGSGNQRAYLLSLIEKLNLQDKVFLKGLTTNVGDKLDEADIFVHASRHEGFGLSILEAMSHSLPVVTTDCPCGPKDIITDGENGFLVHVDDIEAMAEKLEYLISNPSKRQEIGEKAYLRSRDFTVDKIIPMHVALYRSLTK